MFGDRNFNPHKNTRVHRRAVYRCVRNSRRRSSYCQGSSETCSPLCVCLDSSHSVMRSFLPRTVGPETNASSSGTAASNAEGAPIATACKSLIGKGHKRSDVVGGAKSNQATKGVTRRDAGNHNVVAARNTEDKSRLPFHSM